MMGEPVHTWGRGSWMLAAVGPHPHSVVHLGPADPRPQDVGYLLPHQAAGPEQNGSWWAMRAALTGDVCNLCPVRNVAGLDNPVPVLQAPCPLLCAITQV